MLACPKAVRKWCELQTVRAYVRTHERGEGMALDVYFRNDVQNAITSTAVMMLATAAHSTTPVEFIDGALAFAQAQALALGIPGAAVAGDLPAGWVGLEAGQDG